MEKKVNEYRGDDIFKGVIPFDSDYVHSFTPENVENVTIKMRPQTKGEKRDYRRLSTSVSTKIIKMQNGEESGQYTDEIADQWDIVGGTITEWDFKDINDKVIPFTMDAYENIPDWLKSSICDESARISGLSVSDIRLLGS